MLNVDLVIQHDFLFFSSLSHAGQTQHRGLHRLLHTYTASGSKHSSMPTEHDTE